MLNKYNPGKLLGKLYPLVADNLLKINSYLIKKVVHFGDNLLLYLL